MDPKTTMATKTTQQDDINTNGYCINFEDVKKASQRIQNIAHVTPLLSSTSINQLLKCSNQQMKLFFKVEALQKTGSFKFRGALNATKTLMESSPSTNKAPHESQEVDKKSIHVVTHSSGNHAQALALAAQLASSSNQTIEATIVMPKNAPEIKQKAVQSYGAEIVLVENTNQARQQMAHHIVQTSTHPITSFIHPSENPFVIAGQGTVGLEMVSQIRSQLSNDLDIVVIPVGGGGLASGNAIALRGLLGPKLKIILAEPENVNDAKRSKDAGTLLGHPPNNTLNTVADGLKTTLGPNTWPIVRDLVDDIITVSEYDILNATKLVWERLKICIEPSAGVGVAVVLGDEFAQRYGQSTQSYNNVGIILCGGNVDVIKVSNLMQEMNL